MIQRVIGIVLLLCLGACASPSLARVNAPDMTLQGYKDGTGRWLARTQAPVSSGGGGGGTVPAPASVGNGYNCAEEVCRDTQFVSIITYAGETNVVTFTFDQEIYIDYFADGRSPNWSPIPPSTSFQVLTVSITGASSNIDAVFLDKNPNVDAQGLLPPRQNLAGQNRDYGNYSASETLTLPYTVDSDQTIGVGLRAKNASSTSDPNDLCKTALIVGNCLRATFFITAMMELPYNATLNKYAEVFLRPSPDDTVKDLLTFGSNSDGLGFTYDVNADNYLSTSEFTALTPSELTDIITVWTFATEILSIGDGITGDIHSEGGRAFRSDWLVNNYSAQRAVKWYDHMLKLGNNTLPLADRLPAMAAMVSYSKDLYHAGMSCSNGVCDYDRPLRGGAGQGMGKSTSAAVFPATATDPMYGNGFAAIANRPGSGFPETNDPWPYPYQEIAQLNYYPSTGNVLWGDYPDCLVSSCGPEADEGFRRFWSALKARGCYKGGGAANEGTLACDDGTSNRTSRDPYGQIDGPGENPGTGYVPTTLGTYNAMAVTMELWPRFKAVINYPHIITYAHRMRYQGVQVAPDACAPPPPTEGPACNPWTLISSGSNCDSFGSGATTVSDLNAVIGTQVNWGANPNDATRQTCVKINETCTYNGIDWDCEVDPSGTQTGRFEHSTPQIVSPGTTVGIVEAIFNSVIPE